jgi:type I restriction enzyme S subunit
MTALLIDNLPLLAGASNGIKTLRELILELAVRGKLVEQGANDESACELLKLITAEKAQLVVEGKIKKQKPLPAISENEKYFEIPESWQWCRLGQVIDFVNGFAFSSKDFGSEGVGVIKIGDIRDNQLTPETMSRVSESVIKLLDQRLRVEKGDLLIAMSGATTGKLGFNNTSEVFYLNQRVGKIVPISLSSRFIHINLSTKITENLNKSFGSAIPNLSTEQVNEILIALPPLAEQHRIVAKVDELMALCDRLEAQHADAESAHARLVQALLDSLTQASDTTDFAANWQRLSEHFYILFTTESSVDALKQGLLQLAMMGKLVPQNSKDESGSELSERIHISRSDKRKIVMLAEEAVSSYMELLPETWTWCSVDQISADEPRAITDGPFGANLKTEHYIETPGYRVVRLQNIGNGDFRNEHRAYIDQDRFEKISKHQVLSGDLIVAGLIDTSIRCCIAPENIGRAVVKADCYRFSVHPQISSKYVLYYLNSKMAREFAAIHHHGLTLTRIGLGNFRNIPVPLPPAAEQHRIVAKLDKLMALCDQLKNRLTQARQLNEQLASTLVERAVA